MLDVNETGSRELTALEERLRRDLKWLDLPPTAWVPPRFVNGQRVLDVAIIGAGMAGLVASATLRRLGVDNQAVFDRAPAGREGPWMTYARMRTLRSPKQLTGPAMDLPALTFRAYYEARFGEAAWETLGKIPRELWMSYLTWYRQVMNVPVHSQTTLVDIQPGPQDTLTLTLEREGATIIKYARHLVLATGRDGLGGPYLPAFVEGLDRSYWAHTAHEVDFAGLAGRRVAVVGAGASSMDNAASALEAGAAQVDLFIRRGDIPRINKFNGISSPGIVHGFYGLPDAWKWRFLDYAMSEQTPPPRESTLRVSQHPNARFHLGSPITDLAVEEGALRLETPKGRYNIDFLILGTGFKIDIAGRPELSAFAPYIKLWGDGHIPADARPNAELASAPYLGDSFEFLPKQAGVGPRVSAIHCFNFPATLSHGKLTGDIPAISIGADRLARGIAQRLFVEDRDVHYAELQAYNTAELVGDEWRDADAEGEPIREARA